jgi:hypothetical protein
MTDISAIISGKITRDAIKAGMKPEAVQDFVDAVAPQYVLNQLGKVRTQKTNRSPKEAIRAAIASRPEIFNADAAIKAARDTPKGAPFNPNLAAPGKKSNPYLWSIKTDADRVTRLEAISAAISRKTIKEINALAKEAACSVSGRPLAR